MRWFGGNQKVLFKEKIIMILKVPTNSEVHFARRKSLRTVFKFLSKKTISVENSLCKVTFFSSVFIKFFCFIMFESFFACSCLF